MKINIALITIVLFINANVRSQNLNPTNLIANPGAADTFVGGYTFSYSATGTPYNGPLISFGGFDNRYDCQISADYGPNGGNRISFRTRDGDFNEGIGKWNSWNELATRGGNTFYGNQLVNGNVGIGTPTPEALLDVYNSLPGQGKYNVQKWSNRDDKYGLKLQTISNDNGINQEFIQRFSGNDYISLAFYWGRVGIGTSTPDSKLTVAGNIHAQEVKVTLNAGIVPDYVFANDYKLKSLQEVEEYIKQNSHLPEIPSAKEIEKNGLMLAEMNMSLLKKMEEMTLYVIEQNKEIKNLKKENETLKTLSDRLSRVEEELLKNKM